MTEAQSVLLAVAVGIFAVLLAALGRRLPIPIAILQVLGGLVLGLLPGAIALRVSPDLVFFVFLPPVLWAAAFFTSFRDFKANLRPIGLLAIGLVIATTVTVAVVARQLLPGIPWAAAVALGAIVSPPDAVAAESILKRMPIPRRVISILLGESLVNDASALILYRGAVAALITGVYSPGELVIRFFLNSFVGILIGLCVGWLIVWAARRTEDPLAETTLTLLGPYLAWIGAEYLQMSSVLACVAGGLYLRQHYSTVVAPASRIQARAVWDLFLFGLNSLVFLLLGVEFGRMIETLPSGTLLSAGAVGLLIAGLVILVRLIWVPLAAFLPRWIDPALRARDPVPRPAILFIVSWTSMRGMVSLAAALALPFVTAAGTPTPFRSEMVVITVMVIVVTLVLQGLSLTPIIRRLHFARDPAIDIEEGHARAEARRAALDALADLVDEPWALPEARASVEAEIRQAHVHHSNASEEAVRRADAIRRIRLALVRAKRRALIRLRDEQAISDEVLLDLESELDYEALRLGAGSERDR
ncbi:MAG TPA: Na+/H+ antiporter [Gemmatimonadales bacterium]|nr:Na+/H+ antiporter [Gemmatimonadales bacterium]